MYLANVETDSLKIKLKQCKTNQQAAHELMQQAYDQQAVSTYVTLSALILEIEIEIATRQKYLSSPW